MISHTPAAACARCILPHDQLPLHSPDFFILIYFIATACGHCWRRRCAELGGLLHPRNAPERATGGNYVSTKCQHSNCFRHAVPSPAPQVVYAQPGAVGGLHAAAVQLRGAQGCAPGVLSGDGALPAGARLNPDTKNLIPSRFLGRPRPCGWGTVWRWGSTCRCAS